MEIKKKRRKFRLKFGDGSLTLVSSDYRPTSVSRTWHKIDFSSATVQTSWIQNDTAKQRLIHDLLQRSCKGNKPDSDRIARAPTTTADLVSWQRGVKLPILYVLNPICTFHMYGSRLRNTSVFIKSPTRFRPTFNNRDFGIGMGRAGPHLSSCGWMQWTSSFKRLNGVSTVRPKFRLNVQ